MHKIQIILVDIPHFFNVLVIEIYSIYVPHINRTHSNPNNNKYTKNLDQNQIKHAIFCLFLVVL